MTMLMNGTLLIGLFLAWLIWLAFRGRAHRELRAQLYEVIATSARRNLPLGPAIDRMARGHRGWRRTALREVAERLERGETLSEALDASLPRRTLPEHTLASLRATEGTPALRPILERLAASRIMVARARDRVALALAYPSLLAALLLGVHVMSDSFFVLMQEVGGVGTNKGASFATHATIVVFWSMLAFAIASYLAGSSGRFARGMASFADGMPWVGGIRRSAAATRLLRAASALIGAGLPLGDVLRKASHAAGHRETANAALEAARFADGGAPSDEVWRRTNLPDYAVALACLASGSPPKEMSRRLEAAAGACARRLDRSVNRGLAILQPTVVTIFGVLIAIHFASLIERIDSTHMFSTDHMPW